MGSYKCSKCGATFDSRDALRRHIYEAHLSEEDYSNSKNTRSEYKSSFDNDLEDNESTD